jgi:cytochrome c-type biogenesis protein
MTADLTLAAALVAGLLSFLSPCVLPIVPAYLGQLGAISVTVPDASVSLSGRRWDRRWIVMRHALAFVIGFGSVFTVLGVTATYAGQALAPQLPFLRQIGGVLLVILGLNLAGLLPIPLLARTWRPLQAGTSGTVALGQPHPTTPLGAFGLGSIFALGWTPCIGPTLGAIFGLAAVGSSAPALLLFIAYSIGLGIPFLALGLALEEAPRFIQPLRRHARTVEIVGGLLVVMVGLSLIFDWLPWFAARFSFLSPRV